MTATRRPSLPLDLVLLGLLLATVAVVVFRARARSGPPVPLGTPLPPLQVEGWVNLPPGQSFDPHGRLTVVTLFATWCGPCRAELPLLAQLAAAYRPAGVEFLHITQESSRDLRQIEQLVASTPGFTWPVAYGGVEVFKAIPSDGGIPTVILFGPSGRAIWSGPGSFGLDRALDEALAARPRT